MRGLALIRADTTPAGLEVGDVEAATDAKGPSAITRTTEALGRPLVPTLRGIYGERRLESTRRKLGAAGRPEGLTVERYLAKKAGFIVVCTTAAALFWLSGNNLLALVVALLGLVWTDLWLRGEIKRRQDQIERQLPDFLDVLAVTVGAGLSFRSGMARVGASVGGALGEEVLTSLRMMDVGASRRAALEDLRDRNLSPSLAQFVGSLLQAEELGAPPRRPDRPAGQPGGDHDLRPRHGDPGGRRHVPGLRHQLRWFLWRLAATTSRPPRWAGSAGWSWTCA